MGITMLGAIIGSPLSGVVAELSGRVAATVAGESLAFGGILAGALSTSPSVFMLSRFVVGIGVGFCTMCKPLYISETAGERRGQILALFAPALAVGILLAQSWHVIVKSAFGPGPPHDGEIVPSYAYDPEGHLAPAGGGVPSWFWRLELGVGALPPALLLAVALLAMPESPVWLKSRGAAAAVAASTFLRATFASDGTSLLPPKPTGTLALLFSAGAADAGVWALVLAAAQQATGAVAVVYFGSTLLTTASDYCGAALEPWMALVVPAANLGGAIAGAALIDVLGRRKSLATGLYGMAASMLLPLFLLPFVPRAAPPPPGQQGFSGRALEVEALSEMMSGGADGGDSFFLLASLFCMAAWAFFFQLGPGCSYFVVITEVTSPELRPLAVSLGNSFRYALELLLMFTFVDAWGASPAAPALVVLVFAIASLACVLFVSFALVETRTSLGAFDLSGTWRGAGGLPKARGGLDLEGGGRSDEPLAEDEEDTYETQFAPDEPPPQTPRAISSLVAATSSARASAEASIRSFSFSSIGSGLSSAVGKFAPFTSPSFKSSLDSDHFPLPEEPWALPEPTPLSVRVTGADEVAAGGILGASSPAFFASPGFPATGGSGAVYMSYKIESRAPGARRTHHCAQRFSSFGFWLDDLTKHETLQAGASAPRLSTAARGCIDGWRRRLLVERVAAAGDRSREPAVVQGRVVLLQRLLEEVLAFEEVREADATYAFVFGPGWREGDPTATL